MQIETLKRSHLKRNIIIGIIVVLVLAAIILTFTRANYRTTQSIPLVNGTINYSLADLNIVGLYIDGVEADKLDSSKTYTLDTNQSTCTYKDGSTISNLTIGYDSETGGISISPYTNKGTKCTLYFDEKVTAADIILGNVTVNEGTPDFSQVATTDEGVYKAEDNLGTSYYFRGAVTNNYVQFAGYYWRIIRINGDRSIRMIYDGIIAHPNGESSTARRINTSAYNDYYSSFYVGYTYQQSVQRPSTQNGGTVSTIKGVLDNWYTTNIMNKGYDSKVVSTPGFCNDRVSYSDENGTTESWAASGVTIYYAAYVRLVTNKKPTLQCTITNDLYTTKVGLITADEVSMAGGVYDVANTLYYLYTGNADWTMSPYSFVNIGSIGSMFYSGGNATSIGYYRMNSTYGVRPVINISSDVTLTGTGTMSDSYVVV